MIQIFKHLLLTSVTSLGFMAIAATSSTSAFAETTMASIKNKGEVTIGVQVDIPPYGGTNSNNEPAGYDVDVAKLLAKEWGVKLNLVVVTGPNRIPFLLTNKLDMIVASLSITPERAKQVQFSAPYSAATVVIYGDKKTNISSMSDLKGKRIGVPRATPADIQLSKEAPEGTEIRRFDDEASNWQALLSGQVDAIGCATAVIPDIDKRSPGTFNTKFVLKQFPMAVGLRFGDAELLKSVNEFIAKYTANGELNKSYKKWLGLDLLKM